MLTIIWQFGTTSTIVTGLSKDILGRKGNIVFHTFGCIDSNMILTLCVTIICTIVFLGEQPKIPFNIISEN